MRFDGILDAILVFYVSCCDFLVYWEDRLKSFTTKNIRSKISEYCTLYS